MTYFPYAEHLFAIGEQDAVSGVVGLSSLQNFKVYQPYTSQNKIQNLGDKINLERILALQPDLIIISDQDEALYDQLSKIAKTIIVPGSENWQDTITKVAAPLAEEQKAEQYIQDYNHKLDQLASDLDKKGQKGKIAIFMMTWDKGFYYFAGPRMEPYYKHLGFKGWESMENNSQISLEGISKIDPDYIFVGEDYTKKTATSLKELETNPVWKGLKAVRNKHMYVVGTEIVGPLAMGQSKGLDTIRNILEDRNTTGPNDSVDWRVMALLS
nr:ABC transporter substrate-binding protein [Paenibacillus sp. IHB B 3084]